MKAFLAMAAVGLSLVGATGVASAQPYGGRDRDYGYGGRDRDYGERNDGYRDRGGSRDRDYGDRDGGRAARAPSWFDEREYLRCNPDVRQALGTGKLTSALAHYEKFGRREGRRLSC